MISAEPVFGNILMRKVIGAELGENNFGLDREEIRNSSSSVIVSEGFGSTDVSRDRDCLDVNDNGIPSKLDESERRRPGPSVGALLKELGGQAVVFLVAALGISALLAPFGGPSLLSEISGDGLGVLPSALFGSTVGLGRVDRGPYCAVAGLSTSSFRSGHKISIHPGICILQIHLMGPSLRFHVFLLVSVSQSEG